MLKQEWAKECEEILKKKQKCETRILPQGEEDV